MVIFSSRPCTCAATGPSNPLPHFMIIINHAQRLQCFLDFVRNPLYVCTVVCWHHSYISSLTQFSTLTGPEYLPMISPLPVSYLSLPWGRSFCSDLVCQHNECTVRSLASLLILDCWRSFQSTAYVLDQNKGSMNSNTAAAILRLLHLCCQFQCHYC